MIEKFTKINKNIKEEETSKENEVFPIVGIGKQVDKVYKNGKVEYIPYKCYTESQLREIQGLGCNVAMMVNDWNTVERESRYKYFFESLKAAKAVGVKQIIRLPFWNVNNAEIYNDKKYCDLSLNTQLRDRIGNWIGEWGNFLDQFYRSEYAKENIVEGWFLADEPSESEFAYLKNCKDLIVEKHNEFLNAENNSTYDDPSDDKSNINYNCLVDLYPSYANKEQLLGVCKESDISPQYLLYEQYLDLFETTFSPQIWMGNFYPFVETDVNKDPTPKLYGRFLYFNHYMASKAFGTGTKFWAYCLCVQYQGRDKDNPEKISFRFPVPTLQLMKYSVFISIAFGAQGIIYWELFQAHEDELTAPIMFNGVHSSVYKLVRKLNQEIRKYEKVFLGCKKKPEVREYVGPTAEGSNQIYPLISDKYRLKYIDYNKNISSDTKGFIISQLKNVYDGVETTFYILVNLDYENSQTINISFTTDVIDMMIPLPELPGIPQDTINEFSDVENNIITSLNQKQDFESKPINQISEFNGTLAPSDWRIFKVVKR